jgi:hypothetical protein
MAGIEQTRLVKCPYCASAVANKNLEKHIRRQHRSIWMMRTPIPSVEPADVVIPKPPARKKIPTSGTCPVCGKVMLLRHLHDHQKLHEEVKEHPIPVKLIVEPIKIEAGNTQANTRSQKSSERPQEAILDGDIAPLGLVDQHPGIAQVEGIWYRDSEGELNFGVPPEREQHKHIVDIGAGNPSIKQRTSPPNQIPIFKRPAPKKDPSPKSTICPVCNKIISAALLRDHLLEHPRIFKCPVCSQLFYDSDMPFHMAENHRNWCPICEIKVTEIINHLRTSHHLQIAVKMNKLYQLKWRDLPQFSCLYCGDKISLNGYPQHQRPHKPRPKQPEPIIEIPIDPVVTKQPNWTAFCPYCEKEVDALSMDYHLIREHPVCGFRGRRLHRHEFDEHIRHFHPEKIQR